jgi:S1-C subfamily serine protease
VRALARDVLADIRGVAIDESAADGSIVPGDVITAIQDEAVADLDDMLTALERRSPGDTVSLSVWRNGQTRKLNLVLAMGE